VVVVGMVLGVPVQLVAHFLNVTIEGIVHAEVIDQADNIMEIKKRNDEKIANKKKTFKYPSIQYVVKD